MAYVAIVPYADKAYCTAYLADSHLDADAWTDNATKQEAALAQATNAIDQLPLVGAKQDEDTQLREFPRDVDESADIPLEVQNACCEIALSLLQGNTPEELDASIGVSGESVGDASIQYEGERGAAAMSDAYFGLPSRIAASLLAPWIVDQTVIDLTRV